MDLKFKNPEIAKNWFKNYIVELMKTGVGYYLSQIKGSIIVYSTDPGFQIGFTPSAYDTNEPGRMWCSTGHEFEGTEVDVAIQGKWVWLHAALYSLDTSLAICKEVEFNVGGPQKTEFIEIFKENRKTFITVYNDCLEKIMYSVGKIRNG